MRQSSWYAVIIVLFVLMVALVWTTSGGVTTYYDDSTLVAQRNGLDLISGAGIVVTSTDDATNNRVGYTIGNSAKTGTAVKVSTSTSVNITHGLGAAPDRVLVSPTSDSEGVRWWVSTTTATIFTITTSATTTEDITFDWRAQGEE